MCRPRTSIITGSQLQLDLLTAKLKKLEEEQAESEAQSSSDTASIQQPEPSTAAALSSTCRSPFEAESRRRVGFHDEAGPHLSDNKDFGKKISEQNPHFEQRHGEESILLGGEAGPARVASSRSQIASYSGDKGPNSTNIHMEPERLPAATAEKDGNIVLKGVDRFRNDRAQSRVQKLESFDRRIGRQPNAIKEVCLPSTSIIALLMIISRKKLLTDCIEVDS